MDNRQQVVWYAMRATFNREMLAKEMLDKEGIENFIPLRYQVTKHGDKKQIELVPIVHNMLFVRTNKATIQRIKSEVPYLQYLTNPREDKNHPIIVPDEQMNLFMLISSTYDNSLLYFDPQELQLSKGVRVRIHGGLLDGYEGLYVKVQGKRNRRIVFMLSNVLAVAKVVAHPDVVEVLK
jgi:transcription antitermination factor NusG